CNEQFDQFVLNGLAEATFSHRNILITFEYSWLSRTAPIFFRLTGTPSLHFVSITQLQPFP
ncbi:hypothetical protein, partial [Eikenella corrodens]|uniref:hypothetical protein n=1 Tax=Eikenella corrodens TaxID=539 RepID=UPI00195806EA